jgi:hypothetical protein
MPSAKAKRDYQIRNADRLRLESRERARKKREEDPEGSRRYKREWQARRRECGEERLKDSLAKRIWHALRGEAKSARTVELLGCPVCWLEIHLESLFKPGMTWENYGPVWHVDHVRPCASFDLSNPEQQRTSFHWTNLQPLFAVENLEKGHSWPSRTRLKN